MKRWPAKLLSEAYWFQEGPGVRKWQFRNSGIKLLNVGNLTNDGVLDLSKTDKYLSEDEIAHKYSHFLLDGGDLVIASSGISFDEDGLLRTRGAFVESRHLPLCLNTSTIRFKPRAGVSTLAWLRYWLDSLEFREQITRLVTGSAQQNFGPSHLNKTTISLPPLPEQERIVRLLDQADELRKLRAQADRRTAALIPAIFHEMFGDPLANHGSYPIRALEGVCIKITDGTHEPPAFAEKGVPFLFVRNIVNGFIDFNTEKFITEETFSELTRRVKPERGDILYSTVGSYGVAVEVETDRQFAFQRHIGHLKPDRQQIDSGFLAAQLNTPWLKSQADQSARGVAQKTVNLAEIRKFNVLVPPLPLQNRFAKLVTEIRELEAKQGTSRQRLEDLFQSLLHRAFRGEL